MSENKAKLMPVVPSSSPARAQHRFSTNAFIKTEKQVPEVALNIDVNGTGRKAAKRARTGREEVAIYTQATNSETALEVDVMTLDYVAYQAIKATLQSRNKKKDAERPLPLEQMLASTDAFLSIFKARHPEFKPDAELRFRIMLLKLSTMFTQRLTRNKFTPSQDSLRQLRAQQQDRARQWIGSADRIPTSKYVVGALDTALPIQLEDLERNRAHVLCQLGAAAEDETYEDAFYGTQRCISLSDLLPMFMQVSAARMAMSNVNLTAKWMELASDFMLQACLEQYLVYGSEGADAIDQTFSWGYKAESDTTTAVESAGASSEEDINAMFEDDEFAQEAKGWAESKAYYLSELLPETYSNDDLVAHLENLAAEYPIADFEQHLVEFLANLAGSIPEPVLLQLEKGKLNGMSTKETRIFIQSCGLGTVRFFESPIGFKCVKD